MSAAVKDVSDILRQQGPNAIHQALERNQKPYVPKTSALTKDTKEARPLPQIVNAAALVQQLISEPAQLIEGLLHQGSKFVLGGGSKSFKTWSLLDLGMSVSCGKVWWGFKTTQTKVLYINLELASWSFKKRIEDVQQARPELDVSNLDIWNLRGHAVALEDLRPQIVERIKQGYGLIIIDPIYKVYGDRDENAAGDMGTLLNEIEKIAVDTGAAVVFGAHFSKGNQAGKESIDRISGSGVFARDPDTLLIMTKHEQEEAFTVEATLRNFKPIEPFCVQRQHPLMVRNSDLDPCKLKQPGFKQKYTTQQLLDVLGDNTLSFTDWLLKTAHKTSMSKSTFNGKLRELVSQGKVESTKEGHWRKKATQPTEEKGVSATVQ